MTTFLRITVRFLDSRYHGLLSRGGPAEWPPAPFRLFCSMVAGVARRGELDAPPGKALEWLQALPAPVIIAPKAQTGQAFIRYVPNNDGDKKPDRQERLTAKPTIPTVMQLQPDETPSVHYLWDAEGRDVPWAGLRAAARSLTTLGWGIDMAFADLAEPEHSTEDSIRKLPGERWQPKPGVWRGDGMLRVPVARADLKECTLCDLRHCHDTAMRRIEHGQPLHTIDKPRVFDRVYYSSTERPIGLPYACFKLIDDNEDTFRYPHPKLIHIAGMVRHLAINAMSSDPPSWIENSTEWVNRVIRGRKDEASTDEHQQFAYIPLPSIGHEHSDALIRNVMVVAPFGMDRELEHLVQRLSGAVLEPKGEFVACDGDTNPEFPPRIELRNFTPPPEKFIAKRYLGESPIWHTVTPVILDGHDDKKPAKTIRLIQQALQRAGIEESCEFTWQTLPFLKNCLTSHKYDRNHRQSGYLRPKYLKDRTMYHVRVRFAHPVKGPLAIGAGRYRGFGLFAAEE